MPRSDKVKFDVMVQGPAHARCAASRADLNDLIRAWDLKVPDITTLEGQDGSEVYLRPIDITMIGVDR